MGGTARPTTGGDPHPCVPNPTAPNSPNNVAIAYNCWQGELDTLATTLDIVYDYDDAWTADDPGNRTYQPKLSPKWIGPDGRDMVLIWSDAMKDAEGRSHTVNYTWNQMRITIETGTAGSASRPATDRS